MKLKSIFNILRLDFYLMTDQSIRVFKIDLCSFVHIFVMAFDSMLILLLFTHYNSATWISSMNPTNFSNSSLINLLNKGGYAIISADRNPSASSGDFNLTDEIINQRLGNLSDDLTNQFLYSNVLGTYDGLHENSFLVVLHNTLPDEERSIICELGAKYNQESVIYVKQAIPVVQQLIYTTGPFNGTYVDGEGYRILSENVTDNYSRVQLCPRDDLTFTLNFNFTEELLRHHILNRARSFLFSNNSVTRSN